MRKRSTLCSQKICFGNTSGCHEDSTNRYTLISMVTETDTNSYIDQTPNFSIFSIRLKAQISVSGPIRRSTLSVINFINPCN